jgi:hypothetical protein
MVNLAVLNGGKEFIPEVKQPSQFLCPISILIDGAHLDQIGRMCVKPIIIELLALSSEIWTILS